MRNITDYREKHEMKNTHQLQIKKLNNALWSTKFETLRAKTILI